MGNRDFFIRQLLLCRSRSTDRTYSCTSSTLDAAIRINLVMLFAFADRGYRTFCRASTTTDASVTDCICHDLHLLIYSPSVLGSFIVSYFIGFCKYKFCELTDPF